MKNVKFFYAWGLLTLMLGACRNELSVQEFDAWMRDYDNGLHVKKESGHYLFEVQYQPVEWIVSQQHDFSSEDEYLKLVRNQSNLQRYILTVSLKDKNADFINQQVNDLAEKQQLLYYFSYRFQDDVHLEESKRSFPCALYHFERSSDLKNSRTFVLAFEATNEDTKESEIVIESPLFGASPIRIKVTKNNLPTIQL